MLNMLLLSWGIERFAHCPLVMLVLFGLSQSLGCFWACLLVMPPKYQQKVGESHTNEQLVFHAEKVNAAMQNV